MRAWTAALVCTVLMALVASPLLAADKKSGGKTLEGRIVKIDNIRITIEMPDERGGKGVMRTYANYDNSTTVTIDGKDAKMKDLTQRMHVVITVGGKNTAKSIAADTGNDKHGQ